LPCNKIPEKSPPRHAKAWGKRRGYAIFTKSRTNIGKIPHKKGGVTRTPPTPTEKQPDSLRSPFNLAVNIFYYPLAVSMEFDLYQIEAHFHDLRKKIMPNRVKNLFTAHPPL
jgi:hypothetical protein